MSEQNSSTQGAQATDQAAQTATTSTATQTGPNGTAPTMSTSIGSMAELKAKAPEVYNQMLQSVGMKICSEMKAAQERLKEMNRKAREGSA